MKRDWNGSFKKVLNDIWYVKISSNGLFNGMEIVLFPNDELSFNSPGFDLNAFEMFLKNHVETHKSKPNQICFPDSCWLKKYLTKDNSSAKEWLDFTLNISTDVKLGQGGHYSPPLNLLKNKPQGAVEKKKPIWWDKWISSRSDKKKSGKRS